jgi:hypoxanthine phosphoribosyltransferase
LESSLGWPVTAAQTQPVEPLFTAEAIAERVAALAAEIALWRPQDLLVVVVLKGGFVFAADLIRLLSQHDVRLEVEFISLSSYGAQLKSSGDVRVRFDIGCPVAGRDVLIVDDVLDSGLTLRFARDLMAGRGARNVAVAVMIDKPAGRGAEVEADYVGFTCPDYFVVGYGMDAGHAWRQLPYVGIFGTGGSGKE